MKRNEFLEKIHFFNHGVKDDYQTFEYFPKDSFISVELSDDISIALDGLNKKLNIFLKENSIKELTKLNLLDMIDGKSIISNNLTLPYNKLYDYLLNKNYIKEEESIKIYRIEDDQGKGLYRSMEDTGNSISDHFDFCRNTQPSPMEDELLASLFGNIAENRENNKNWFFGFNSRKEISNWLDNDGLKEFILENNKNINIVEYKVSSSYAIKTKKQVAFIKKEAEKIKAYPLKDMEIIIAKEITNNINDKIKTKPNKSLKII